MYLLNFFFIFIGKNFSDQAFFFLFFDSTTRREPIRKEQKRKKKDIRENVDQLHNNVEL